MKHKTLFAALALALATAATTLGAAEPAAKPERSTKPALDVNGDGVIDRAEAAKAPRLAERFDTLDKNRDGKLDASERPQRHGEHGGRNRRGAGGHGGVAALDTNGDGRLSKAEVEAGRGGREGRANPLLGHFAAIDTNKDGQLVRTEVQAWHEKQRPLREAERRKRFDETVVAADLNKDGRLSRVEVDEKMPRITKQFAWMDSNGDGFLSRAELAPPTRR